MAVKIVADSTCDLTPELIRQFDITILPLYVRLGTEDHKDGVDISSAQIFEYVEKEGVLPKTAAVTIADFSDCFERLFAESPETEILCITIGSGFSSTFQNAQIAAGQFERVSVVDSRNLSSGFGHVVLAACELAQKGRTAVEIKHFLEIGIIPKVDASFIINRLDYLHKGGRCSSLAALGANLLRLKPCIEVRDGQMTVGKKYRGGFTRCVTQYVQDRMAEYDMILPERIFITHAAADADAVEAARQAINEAGHFDEIIESNAGCTVASHCGPCTLGVLYIRK